MMKKQDADFLKKFLKWNDCFDVTSSGQMLISYRKTPDGAFCGVEGWLQDKDAVPAGIYYLESACSLMLEQVDPMERGAPWDHDVFRKFISSNKLARFEMSGKYISLCSKFLSGVIFRFQQVDDQDSVRELRLHEIVDNQKPLFVSENPECHIGVWFWRKLTKKDFWVTVLANGFFIFEQTDGDFIIYLKSRMVPLGETPLGPLTMAWSKV